MRFAACLVMLVLAGCDQPPVQPSGGSADETDATLQTEAEKACAQMTNYVPEKLQAMSAQTQALVRREFNRCVEEVMKDEAGGSPAEEAPGLRGHTEAPT